LARLCPPSHLLEIEEVIGLEEDLGRAIAPSMYMGMRPHIYGYKEDMPQDQRTKVQMDLRKKLVAPDGDILRMLGYLENCLPHDSPFCPEYIAGKQVTIADCQLIPRLRHLKKGILDGIPTTIMDGFPKLCAYYDRFHELPAVKKYYEEVPKTLRADCKVSPEGKPCHGGAEQATVCTGEITLTQVGDECRISYVIRGLSQGLHGFHIHEKADFSNGCISAGPHYNPFGKTHGSHKDEERHVGDLGNIKPNKDGVARGTIVDKLIKLDGEHNVIGRSFMVHADPDDLGKGDNSETGPPPVNGKCSKATGNAGARIACGEIKLRA